MKVNWKTAERFVAGRDSSVRKLRMPAGGAADIAASRQRRLAHGALFARQKGTTWCALRGGMRFSPHCSTPLQQLDQIEAIATG